MPHTLLCAARLSQVWYCSSECQKAHWTDGGHKKGCKAFQAALSSTAAAKASSEASSSASAPKPTTTSAATATAGGGGSVDSRALDDAAKTLTAMSVSDLKQILAKMGETSDGCLEKADLVKRALSALERTARGQGGVGGGVPTRHVTSTLRPTPVPSGGVCIICLEHDPPPIQSGCACRGDAGLAHVACRILAAEHKSKSSGPQGWGSSVQIPWLEWTNCPTCGQCFNGAMSNGVSEEWLRRVQGRPEITLQRAVEWSQAAATLCGARITIGREAEAEATARAAMASIERMGFGQQMRPVLLQLEFELARAINFQGKFAEAQPMLEDCRAQMSRQYGPDNDYTLQCSKMLGDNLCAQGKLVEAEKVLRDTLKRDKKALGAEYVSTLQCSQSLASVLFQLGKNEEALAMYQELLPVMKRVLGPEHISVLGCTSNYAKCLAVTKRFVEAEAMLLVSVETMGRVSGAESESTKDAVKWLSFVRTELKRK
jgi:hypothetical protein